MVVNKIKQQEVEAHNKAYEESKKPKVKPARMSKSRRNSAMALIAYSAAMFELRKTEGY